MINLVIGLVATGVIATSSVSFLAPVVTEHAEQEKYIAALLCDANAQMYRSHIDRKQLSEVVDRCSKKAAEAVDDRYAPVLSLLKPFV